MEGSDERPSASLAGPAGEAKEPPPREVAIEFEAAEVWHLQTSLLHHRVALPGDI